MRIGGCEIMTNDTDATGAESASKTRGQRGSDTPGGAGVDETATRRQVLKTSAAAATATAGLGAAGGSAQAGMLNCAKWPEGPDGYPEIDMETGYANFDINAPDETTIYIHGWNELGNGTDQAYTLEEGLNSEYGWWWHDYPGDVVATTWDSNTLDFGGAWEYAGEIGHQIAEYVDHNWDRQNTLNVVGHSLGARAALNMLNGLNSRGVSINNVVLCGAAVHDDSVCSRGDYVDGIKNAANDVTSLHSSDDFAVCGAYELWPEWLLQSALGCKGPDCGWWSRTPDNFTATDLTSDVDNHCEYFTEDGSGGDHAVLSGLGH